MRAHPTSQPGVTYTYDPCYLIYRGPQGRRVLVWEDMPSPGIHLAEDEDTGVVFRSQSYAGACAWAIEYCAGNPNAVKVAGGAA